MQQWLFYDHRAAKKLRVSGTAIDDILRLAKKTSFRTLKSKQERELGRRPALLDQQD